MENLGKRAIYQLSNDIKQVKDRGIFGRVLGIQGMLIEIGGVAALLSVGDRCNITLTNNKKLRCEVIGFRPGIALAMPYGGIDGIGLGARVEIIDAAPMIYPSNTWLGRTINGFGEAIDGLGKLSSGSQPYLVHNKPPPAHSRKRIKDKIDLGIKALNLFVTCCRGQRMGIFAGSGVGKSVLMSMIAKYTSAEIIVIGLIGERGREVQEFIQEELGQEGLARSVIIVATSDEPALMRREAAYMTMTVAEYFRDQGHDVLCLMDSITRFAMAQREIGLSIGEPPATRGFTPTVFAEMPRLLERAGPGAGQGDITGLFTVLVEGDDHNEPISDAIRGILDGHIVLERAIAERNRFPAINLLRSVSRTMPDCNTEAQNLIVERAKTLLSAYEDMAELIRLGAYREGSDAHIDEAITYYPQIEEFARQQKDQAFTLDEAYQNMAKILGIPYE